VSLVLRVLAPFALLAALACAACDTMPTTGGYELQSRYSKAYRTVAVTLFKNDTFDRPLNGELTEALVKEVQASTPYHISSESRADTLLRGTVRTRTLRELSKSRSTGLSEEMLYEVTVDWEWVDQRTGKVIVARNGFSGSALFVPSRPSSEPTEIGRLAVVQNLATDIVANMQANW
jgi:hypothetical protein